MMSTCGDLTLEAVKRRTRRILGPSCVGMEQDALLLKGGSNKVKSTPYMASSYDDASDHPLGGGAQVATKKMGGKGTRGKNALFPAPPVNHPKNGATTNRINPRTGCRNRRFARGSEFHLLPQRPDRTPNSARRVPISMDHQEGGVRDAAGGEVFTSMVSPGLLAGRSVSDGHGRK